MIFKVGTNTATPLKVTIRDSGGVEQDLSSYDLAIAEIHKPSGEVLTVNATKQQYTVLVSLPELSEQGLWSIYIGLKKQAKIDYCERIDFSVE